MVAVSQPIISQDRDFVTFASKPAVLWDIWRGVGMVIIIYVDGFMGPIVFYLRVLTLKESYTYPSRVYTYIAWSYTE